MLVCAANARASFHLIVHPRNFLIHLLLEGEKETRSQEREGAENRTAFLSTSSSALKWPFCSFFPFVRRRCCIFTLITPEIGRRRHNRRQSRFFTLHVHCLALLVSSCSTDTRMSTLLRSYRARSATTLSQIKPLHHRRSRSPDDVLHRQQQQVT